MLRISVVVKTQNSGVQNWIFLTPAKFSLSGLTRWMFKSGIDQAKGRLACGSMVLFYLFTKMLHFVQHFCEKNVLLRPAGGEFSFRV
jgi:hypothetical protein